MEGVDPKVHISQIDLFIDSTEAELHGRTHSKNQKVLINRQNNIISHFICEVHNKGKMRLILFFFFNCGSHFKGGRGGRVSRQIWKKSHFSFFSFWKASLNYDGVCRSAYGSQGLCSSIHWCMNLGPMKKSTFIFWRRKNQGIIHSY